MEAVRGGATCARLFAVEATKRARDKHGRAPRRQAPRRRLTASQQFQSNYFSNCIVTLNAAQHKCKGRVRVQIRLGRAPTTCDKLSIETLAAASACRLGAHICITGLALVTDFVIELLKTSLLSDASLYLCDKYLN